MWQDESTWPAEGVDEVKPVSSAEECLAIWGEKPENKEACVRFIMVLMTSERFETGITGPELQLAWGMSETSIKQYTAEASRRVKALTDPNWVRERIATCLDEALDHARGKPKDLAAVANAYAPLVGASVPQKHEITVAAMKALPAFEPTVEWIRGFVAPERLEEFMLGLEQISSGKAPTTVPILVLEAHEEGDEYG